MPTALPTPGKPISRQHEGQRFLGLRQGAARLRAHRADGGIRHQQVEHGADRQRADQADRDVAVRILGFFGGGGYRIEADIREEDGGGSTQYANAGQRSAPAVRKHRFEVAGLTVWPGQHDEYGQCDDLDHHQHRSELGDLEVPSTSSQVTSSADGEGQ